MANLFLQIVGYLSTNAFYEHVLKLEQLQGMDLVQLKADKPETPANLTSLLVFDKPIEFEKLKEQIYEKVIKKHPKIRNMIVKRYGEYFFQKSSIETAMNQIQTYKDISNDQEQKQALLEIGQNPMELDKPLFNFYYVPKYKESKSAFIVRLHHVLADGPSAFATVCSLADNFSPKILPPIRNISLLQHLVAYFLIPLHGLMFGVSILSDIIKRKMDKKGFMGTDFKAKKTLTVSQNYNLALIKKRCKQLSQENDTNITINDFIISILQQSCKTYHVKHNLEEPKEILAMAPFTLQDFENITLSNKVAGFVHSLPMISSLEDGGLKQVKSRLGRNYKRQLGVLASSKATQFYSQAIPSVLDKVSEQLLGTAIDYVCTNVPGPREQLSVCGAKVEEMFCAMPSHPQVGGFLSLITSYAGSMRLSLTGDEGYLDIEEIKEYFEKHMNEQIMKIDQYEEKLVK